MQGTSDANLGRCIYAYFTRILRRTRNAKRRALGPSTPDWLEDLSGVIGALNLISTIPTFVAIICSPYHFFRHVRNGGKRASPLFLSPVKLLLQTSAIVALAVSLTSPKFEFNNFALLHIGGIDTKYLLVVYLSLLVLTMPVWLTSFSVIVETFAAIIMLFLGLSFAQLCLRILWDLFRFHWSEAEQKILAFFVLVIISMAIPRENCKRCRLMTFYFKIDWIKYSWGCVYLGCGIFIFLLVSLSIIAFVLSTDRVVNLSETASNFLIFGLILCVALIVRVVISSYTGMLEAASLYPRQLFFRNRCKSIRTLGLAFWKYDKKLRQMIAKDKSVKFSKELKRRNAARRLILEEIDLCLRESDLTELRLRSRTELLNAFHAERSFGLVDLMDVTACLDKEADKARFQALCSLKDTPFRLRIALYGS